MREFGRLQRIHFGNPNAKEMHVVGRSKSIRIPFFIACGALLAWTGIARAEGPQGVAFVEAPEQGGGVCFSDNADKGFACAKEKCMESGAFAEDCFRVKWCYPAEWSADIFKQHREGPHWHDYLCGWKSEADLDAAIRIACEGSSAEYLIECAAVAKWSPEGKKTEINP